MELWSRSTKIWIYKLITWNRISNPISIWNLKRLRLWSLKCRIRLETNLYHTHSPSKVLFLQASKCMEASHSQIKSSNLSKIDNQTVFHKTREAPTKRTSKWTKWCPTPPTQPLTRILKLHPPDQILVVQSDPLNFWIRMYINRDSQLQTTTSTFSSSRIRSNTRTCRILPLNKIKT